MSRGLTQEEAKKKIIEGFFNPMMDNIKTELNQDIKNLILERC